MSCVQQQPAADNCCHSAAACAALQRNIKADRPAGGRGHERANERKRQSRSHSFRKTQRGFNASTWSLQLLLRSIRQAGRGTSAVMIHSFQQKPLHNTGTKERVSAKTHCVRLCDITAVGTKQMKSLIRVQSLLSGS